MYEVLSKVTDPKTSVETIASAAPVPGGVVLRTTTVLRETFAESSVFLPGVILLDGKLAAAVPALVDYFDPSYLKNLVADAVIAAKADLPLAQSQDCKPQIDAAIADLKSELPVAPTVSDLQPLIDSTVAAAIAKLPVSTVPETPDFNALAEAAAQRFAPAPAVIPDVAAIVAAEVAKIPAPQLPDLDAIVSEKVAAAIAALPKPVDQTQAV